MGIHVCNTWGSMFECLVCLNPKLEDPRLSVLWIFRSTNPFLAPLAHHEIPSLVKSHAPLDLGFRVQGLGFRVQFFGNWG